MQKTDVIGIFEGGGASGIAHIGAVAECERRGLRFKAVAGTSAGAIIAALVAAGYSGQEMLRTASQVDEHREDPKMQGLFSCELLDLFATSEWQRFKRVRFYLKLLKKCLKGIRFVDWGSGWLVGCTLGKLVGSSICRIVGRIVYGFTLSALALGLLLGIHLIPNAGLLSLLAIAGLVGCLVVSDLQFVTKSHGYLSTERFFTKFEGWLRAKCPKSANQVEGNEFVRFKDLPNPLTIIAFDVQRRRLKKFCAEETPNVSVSRAVTASMAIPIIFQPVLIEGQLLIDGGAASAFPAWAADDHTGDEEAFQHVLGFRLGSTEDLVTTTFTDYFYAVSIGILFGDDSLETRLVSGLQDIRVATGVRIDQFDLNNKQKRAALREGVVSAATRVVDLFLPNRENIQSALEFVVDRMRMNLSTERKHLRANLALLVKNRGKLRISCRVNFDETDCDDRLEFDLGCGATGRCWDEGKIQLVNLNKDSEKRNSKWKMTKYQHKLVRTELRSLLSIPVVLEQDWDDAEARVKEGVEPLGVLNFDSDHELNQGLASSTGVLRALRFGFMIAKELRRIN